MDVPARDEVYDLLRHEGLGPREVDDLVAWMERGASDVEDREYDLALLEVDRVAGTVTVRNELGDDWSVLMSLDSFRTLALTHATAMTLRRGGHARISPGYAESLRHVGTVNVDDLERMGFRVTRWDETPPPTI